MVTEHEYQPVEKLSSWKGSKHMQGPVSDNSPQLFQSHQIQISGRTAPLHHFHLAHEDMPLQCWNLVCRRKEPFSAVEILGIITNSMDCRNLVFPYIHQIHRIYLSTKWRLSVWKGNSPTPLPLYGARTPNVMMYNLAFPSA